ncbi:MAG: hypothetical protein WA871_08710 [Candidatus Acidiferrales bacterium]
MIDWRLGGPVAIAAFFASLVEFVEAVTIVLAVGVTRGWRWALIGSGAGGFLLILTTLGFGSALQLVPLANLQIVIGALLLLFGLNWLRKAILRAAGIVGRHDEDEIFAKQTKAMGATRVRPESPAFDGIALITTFKAVVIEGLEVVFIVIAVGAAGGMLLPASMGAIAAAFIVAVLGIVLHRPLARVPENTLKFSVAILLCSFGVFWIGEGLRLRWPGEDLAILYIAAGLFIVSAIGVRRRKHQALNRLLP